MARSLRALIVHPESQTPQSGESGSSNLMLSYLYLLTCEDSQQGRWQIRQKTALRLEDRAWPMGKCFHRAEATFLGREGRRGGLGDQRMGELEAHQMIAIGVRHPQGSGAQIAGRLGQASSPTARGALGISSKTCAESGKERRTATRAPPAEMFSAVANSRRSLPFSSRLRTKTGIAMGRRGHLRRSASRFYGRFKPTPLHAR